MSTVFTVSKSLILTTIIIIQFAFAETGAQEYYTKVYLEADRIVTTDTSIEYINHASNRIPLTFLGVDHEGIFTFTNRPEQFLWIMCPRCNREHFLGFCPATDGF